MSGAVAAVQALASRHRRLFVMVDGATGAGKTTLVRAIQAQVETRLYRGPRMGLASPLDQMDAVLVDPLPPEVIDPIVYKTFDGDDALVPGLMQRGHLDIAQSSIFALDAMIQVLTRGVVIFDRSPLSALACAQARANTARLTRSDTQRCDWDNACRIRQLVEAEYPRLLARVVRLPDTGVVHVMMRASEETLRAVHTERQDPRPWDAVAEEVHTFPAAMGLLPEGVHQLYQERP